MRGVGSSLGAITIVNALPTGVGAAAAVGLRARAEVEIAPEQRRAGPELVVLEGERTPLVEASYRAGLAAFANGALLPGRLRLSCEIPPARGLKSSSAVSVAILGAVARALGRESAPEETSRLSAKLAQEIGVSATGAFDDALACAEGGVAITDNRMRQVLRRCALPQPLAVLLWVPPGMHAPSPSWKEAFELRADEGQAVVDAALAGDLLEAMERNSLLVEAVVGYPYSGLRRRLREAGAVGCGVSGLGPAIAALVPPDRTHAVERVLRAEPGETILTDLRPPLGTLTVQRGAP